MKRYSLSVLLATAAATLLLNSILVARSVDEVPSKRKISQVKTRLAELFTLCRNNDYTIASTYLVYRGPVRKRKWKDTYNYNNRSEQGSVDAICREIRDLLVSSEGYEIGAITADRESEGEWIAVVVRFKTSGAPLVRRFAFLKVKGAYCLGDIDGD